MTRALYWLYDAARDLRHAIRSLSRSAGFTATVILILALGTGANTAMFSIIYGVLLRPLPYPDADAIVSVGEPSGFLGNISGTFLSNRSLPLLQDNADSFEQIAAYRELRRERDGITLRGASVSPTLFPLLRARPHLGRLFLDEDARIGAPRIALLSHRAWTNHFAADPNIVGTSVNLDNNAHLVVGVLADGFHFPTPDSDFWLPYTVEPPGASPADGGIAARSPLVVFRAIGRLRPSVSAEQAEAEARSILQENSSRLSRVFDGRDVRVVPLLEEMVGEYRPALLILTVVTVISLLVACMNAAGLLLARGAARRRMLAISAALGAGRGRLVRQLLTESLVLSLAAGLLGLVAAALCLRAVPLLVPGDIARLDEVGINGAVFAFAAGLSILVGLLCGAGTAFQWSQLHLVRTLNDATAQSAGSSGLLRAHRARAALSTAQIALGVTLLIGAGLLVRSFMQLLSFDRGFDPTNVITVVVTNPIGMPQYEMATRQSELQASHQQLQERLSDEVVARLQPLADIEAVGVSRHLPFGRNTPSSTQLRPAGTPVPSDPNEMVRTSLQIASPGFLDALRFRLIDGRTLGPQDGRDGQRALVANETLARELFGREPAVGRQVTLGVGQPWEIVGVVGDIVYGGLDLTGERQAEAYFPLAQATESIFGFSSGVRVSVRTASGSMAVVPFLREAITAANPQATIGEVTTMEARLLNAVAWPRVYAFFVGALATLVLILAAVGVYGLLSYTVAQREREIGIRMALGAAGAQIVRLVLGQGAVLVGVGILVGVVAALAGSRALESLLYGIEADDPLTFLLAPLLLAAIALVACWLPARRATNVDPMSALRFE